MSSKEAPEPDVTLNCNIIVFVVIILTIVIITIVAIFLILTIILIILIFIPFNIYNHQILTRAFITIIIMSSSSS